MLRQRNVEKREQEKSAPSKGISKSSKKQSGKLFFLVLACLAIILYVVIPATFYLCPSIRRHIVFLHYVSLSQMKNLSSPKELGLNCTTNFYVRSDDKIQLGSWHIPAAEAMSRCEGDSFQQGKEFADSRPVFLYLHGNAGSRGGSHRIRLYEVLSQKVNAHVVAFDYRGYADSSNVDPNQSGLVNDSVHVYNWIRQHADMKRIYVWGHSLGTGVGTALVEKLLQNKEIPAGLILEAPFTKLMDAVRHHPLSFLHRYMPFFDFFFTNPIANETSLFNSINKISHLKSPVLILHAEDDSFIPYHQAKELYAAAKQREFPLTQFVGFESELGYGHKNIYKDPKLPNIVKQFLENTQAPTTKT